MPRNRWIEVTLLEARVQERLSLWPESFAFGCRGRGEVGKILTVTFTKAATEELRGRIRELLVVALASFQGEKNQDEDPTIARLKELESVPVEESIRRLRLAITCFDEAIISTIHGFCQRVLAENSLRPIVSLKPNWISLLGCGRCCS